MTTVKTVHVILRPKKTTTAVDDAETKKAKAKRRNSISGLTGIGKEFGKELVRKLSFRRDGFLRRSLSNINLSKPGEKKKMPVPTSNGNGHVAKGSNIIVVELQKKDTGLGFNIVGGTDSEHIPGDSGIFITKIKANGAAYNDGRLQEGDRILSVNGQSLVEKSHEDAVGAFRGIKGSARLEVEQEAERTALSKPSDAWSTSAPIPPPPSVTATETKIPNGTSTPSGTLPTGKLPTGVPPASSATTPIGAQTTPKKELLGYVSPTLGRKARGPLASTYNKEERGKEKEDPVDTPVMSASQSAQSLIDDVPRTPKKPSSIFDSSSYMEGVYVVAGLAAIGVGCYVVYRYVWKR
uniref:PDZ domain-containing protein n=1 Tax=Plectus sambesii TaxID=2011161 RepID=A0A914UK23_9BILA